MSAEAGIFKGFSGDSRGRFADLGNLRKPGAKMAGSAKWCGTCTMSPPVRVLICVRISALPSVPHIWKVMTSEDIVA